VSEYQPRIVPKGGFSIAEVQMPSYVRYDFSSARPCRGDVFYVVHQAVVSSCIHVLHYNSSIFANPNSFVPERWLGEEEKLLDPYLVPFSKGTRICIGAK
jgi:hypothetical protein